MKLSDSTASTRQEETINKLDKQMRILSQQMEEISTITLNMMENLMRANEAVAMSMENTCDVLGKNAEACQSLSKNLTMISKNIQPDSVNANKSDILGPQVTVETSNTFSMLDNIEEEQYEHTSKQYDPTKVQKSSQASKKVLILGNSHIKHIRTEHFLPNCIVIKMIAFSCDEVLQKIEMIDDDFDMIFIHMFSYDLRGSDLGTFVNEHDELISTLQNRCKFAQFVFSLPFFTVKNFRFNAKVEQCCIMIKFKYLNSPLVHVCDSANLYSNNKPIHRFYERDGLHLSDQGLKVFITNMKYHIRKILHIESFAPRKEYIHEQQKKTKKTTQHIWNKKVTHAPK